MGAEKAARSKPGSGMAQHLCGSGPRESNECDLRQYL